MNPNSPRPMVSVVIPVYNERATIEEILFRVQAVDVDKEIVVVDDGAPTGYGGGALLPAPGWRFPALRMPVAFRFYQLPCAHPSDVGQVHRCWARASAATHLDGPEISEIGLRS